jgi:hypothetical protein
MTFSEYINQVQPKQHNNVEVKRSECSNISNVLNGREIITLNILGDEYYYLKLKTSNILYTMDLDGNKKSCSVFTLID